MSTNMRAWVYKTSGLPAEVVKEDLQFKRPVIKEPTDVLVRMVAASVNPVDWKLMVPGPMSLVMKKPSCCGMDFSGIVEDTGPEAAEEFKKGSEVYGKVAAKVYLTGTSGSFAEYIVVPAKQIVVKPANINMEEAAGVALAGLTAWQALNFKNPLKAGDRVFINGGSGGVGTFAVQEAKAVGCYVVTTCSSKNIDMVKSLGADEVVDYTVGDLIKNITDKYGATEETKFEHIFDNVGSMELYNKCKAYTKEGAVFTTVAPEGGMGYVDALKGVFARTKAAYWGIKGRTFKMLMLDETKEELLRLNELIAQDKVKPQIDSIHNWDCAVDVLTRSMSHKATGKIILKAPAAPGVIDEKPLAVPHEVVEKPVVAEKPAVTEEVVEVEKSGETN